MAVESPVAQVVGASALSRAQKACSVALMAVLTGGRELRLADRMSNCGGEGSSALASGSRAAGGEEDAKVMEAGELVLSLPPAADPDSSSTAMTKQNGISMVPADGRGGQKASQAAPSSKPLNAERWR